MLMACSPDIFGRAFDHIPDAVLITDGTGTVEFANRQLPALLGYSMRCPS
jgi:PAS domain-containing protein